MWSSKSMPTIAPAALSCAVISMSLGDGSRPPLGWLWATMIAGGAIGQRVGEDFAGMHGAAVDQADGNDPDVQDLVRAVDGGAEEMLLLAVGVVADVGQQIGRGLDLRAFRLDAAAGELDGGQDEAWPWRRPPPSNCARSSACHVQALFVDEPRPASPPGSSRPLPACLCRAARPAVPGRSTPPRLCAGASRADGRASGMS